MFERSKVFSLLLTMFRVNSLPYCVLRLLLWPVCMLQTGRGRRHQSIVVLRQDHKRWGRSLRLLCLSFAIFMLHFFLGGGRGSIYCFLTTWPKGLAEQHLAVTSWEKKYAIHIKKGWLQFFVIFKEVLHKNDLQIETWQFLLLCLQRVMAKIHHLQSSISTATCDSLYIQISYRPECKTSELEQKHKTEHVAGDV